MPVSRQSPQALHLVKHRSLLLHLTSNATMLPWFAMSAARWVVLLPGAAQASTSAHPGCGASAWAGMQEALLCSTSTPLSTSGWSCRSVPGGKVSRSGSSSSTAASWPCEGGHRRQG